MPSLVSSVLAANLSPDTDAAIGQARTTQGLTLHVTDISLTKAKSILQCLIYFSWEM